MKNFSKIIVSVSLFMLSLFYDKDSLIMGEELEDIPPYIIEKEVEDEKTIEELIQDYELIVEDSVEEPQIVDEILWESPCGTSSTKSYMDYKEITLVTSAQYQYIRNNMYISNGLLYEGDYIGVALGSWWGGIGSKWTIELDTGVVLKVVKIDEKSDAHTYNGCGHISDGSVIEIVVDSETIPREWLGSNGYILNGNFNNLDMFRGNILRVSRERE